MPWLEAFKLALIQDDEQKLVSLIDTLPQFSLEDDMIQASLLIQQAITFFKAREKDASVEMHKILKAKKYLED